MPKAPKSPSSRKPPEPADGRAPIDDWMRRVMPDLQPVIRRVDDLIHEVVPEPQYAVKWRRAFYGLPELGWIIELAAYDVSMNVVFHGGADFADPPPLGEGRSRYVKLTSVEDAEDPAVRRWIEQAATVPGQLGEPGGGVALHLCDPARPVEDHLQLVGRVVGAHPLEVRHQPGEQPLDLGGALPQHLDDLAAPVLGVAPAADEAARLQPVEDPGDRGGREPGELRELAGRQRAVALEQVERLVVGGVEPEVLGDGRVEHDHGVGVLAPGGLERRHQGGPAGALLVLL